jgi:hypothetical protein
MPSVKQSNATGLHTSSARGLQTYADATNRLGRESTKCYMVNPTPAMEFAGILHATVVELTGDYSRGVVSKALSTSDQGLSSAPGFLVIGTKKTGNMACCSIFAPCFRNR